MNKQQSFYTLREYAEATGQGLAAVRQQAHRGTLHTTLISSPLGSYRVVGQAAVNEYLAQQAYSAALEFFGDDREALDRWKLEQGWQGEAADLSEEPS